MQTRVTQLLGTKYPIVQGGLANLAYSELAAAVSNAGGLGQITATSLPSPAALREQIQKTKRATDRPFGVNIAIGQHKSVAEFVEVLVEQGVRVVSLTGGNPEPVLRQLEGANVKKLILTSTVRQAQKAESLGADAVMAVGQEGGGHIGRADTGTMVLIPRVAESVQIPVIASGGIADGRGLMAALALGAEGIEMGTRFIATKECSAHAAYKQAVVAGQETDTVVIKRTIGAPGRVLPSPWVERILEAEAQGTTVESLWPYISGERNRQAIIEGKLDEGFAWVGQSMGLVHSVPTVAELFAEIMEQAKATVNRLDGMGI